MSQATVDNILREIESLSEADRELLNRRLAELDEARWHREAAEIRQSARRAGVDQDHIDQTIRTTPRS